MIMAQSREILPEGETNVILLQNSQSCQTPVLVAQPKILKINFVNIITKFYITI